MTALSSGASAALASLLATRARLLSLPRSEATKALDAELLPGLKAVLSELEVRDVRFDGGALLNVVRHRDAVHPVENEADLARRLAPDRGIEALVHPLLPDAPFAFLEFALTRGMPTSVQQILSTEAEVLDPALADYGVFYGISNTEPGAAGLAVGALLIERLLVLLPSRFPQVKQWVTLSPVPTLRAWVESVPEKDRRGLPCVELARRYLSLRDALGRPLDPVARFHLGNGAVLGPLFAGANDSERAAHESFGVMASYVYSRG